MYLKNIRLRQFKNYRQVSLGFSDEVNCFLGLNGAGKTNLLDAIHYLCLTKSAFNSIDQHQVLHGEGFFSVKGSFLMGKKSLDLLCSLENGKKKQFQLNGKPYDKMSEHIGLIPVVLIAPDDSTLIKDGSEERRKFFDSMLSQLDQAYLQLLLRYQHCLKQRNALLKAFHETGRKDTVLLEPYNKELIRLSREIHELRLSFIKEFIPLVCNHYEALSNSKESIHIAYQSDVGEADFERDFLAGIDLDILLKRTKLGIHRDDYEFTIDGHPLKKFGSQGQQKSFLIGLKLAQFDVFNNKKNQKPLLLLDDIFDKLDDQRIGQLMKLVADKRFGQLFITDARPERSRKIFTELGIAANLIYIDQGNIVETSST